jgi:thiol-disulfide isomerase/thioredoxin
VSHGRFRFRRFAAETILFCLCAPVLYAQSNPTGKPPMEVGRTRPLIDFTTVTGNHPTWTHLKGKVVVIDFWASWCGPCIASFPQINELQKEFANSPIVFYSVSYETRAMVRTVTRKHPLETQVALDNDFHTFKSFGAWGLPVVFIFDANGALAAEIDPTDLNAAVLKTVLAGKRPTVPQQKGWPDPAGAEAYFRSQRQKEVEGKP